MRTIILFCAAIFLSVAGKSQAQSVKATTSGKIIYQEKVKLDIKLEGDAAQYADSMPKEQATGKVLFFNPEYSLYQTDESKKDDVILNPQTSHGSVRMIVSGGNDKLFSDLKEKKKTEQKDFMTRLFLVGGELGYSDWKLTGNTSTILGYSCQEAVREEKGKSISAWFTASIPISTGPAGYAGLPGMVLLVNSDNGKKIITATSIDFSFDVSTLLIKPTQGKKVTDEEFKNIVEEKMKEMGTEAGEGGTHVMIRVNN